MPKIHEFQVIEGAVNSLIMKMNCGEITRDDLGEVVALFLRLSCTLNNRLIDTNNSDEMSFADMLYDLSEDMRSNNGKAPGL
jgi:hypothetical protein